MSQNGHSQGPSAGGTIGLGHSVVNHSPGSSMNLSSSPSSVVTWSHVNNGASVSGAAGNQSTSTQHQQQDAKTAGTPSSPQDSNHSGTTLKEHDLLGLSDVSSSTSRESPVQDNLQDEGNDFEELNLKMELGPPAARKKVVETNTAAFPHPRTQAAPTEQHQQVSSVTESGNSQGGCLDGSQAAEQSQVVAVEKVSSNAELQNGAPSEQQVSSDRGLSSYGGNPSQPAGRADTGAGGRTLVDSEALTKWHSEQGGGDDRKSSNEGLRLGISLNSQRGIMHDALHEKNSFLNSIDRRRDSAQELKKQQQQQQEDPSWQQERNFQEDVPNAEKAQERLMVQDQQKQQQQVTKQQQQQLERQKQYEAYQMSDKRPIAERRCPPALQPPSMEQRFQNVPERSPRHADPGNNNNRLWANQIKFPTMVASCVPYHQQHHAAQQDIEASRAGFPVSAGNFAVNRNMYAAQKLGVTGSKRNFDAITCPDTRNVNDARSGGLCGPSPVSGSSMNNTGSVPPSTEVEAKAALCQQQIKGQPGMQMYPWSQKPTLAAPSWHMGGLEQSGGSFGPFPSQQRPTSGATVAKNAAEVAAAANAVDAKTWDGQLKVSHQEVVSTSSQKMSAPAETNQPSSEANTSLTAEASTVAPPRASPAPVAVGWPPLRSFTRRNLAVVPPRPVPSETPPPRQPSTPASASTPSVAGQSNSWFVKVNMDGYPVGRKVDLRNNSSYDKLSQALDEMFRPQFETFLNGQNNVKRMSLPCDLKRNFLQGPDFVLTYEDQEGDLMLVGDVPWTMFIDTVKRLRIMKGSEAIGLGNRAAEKSMKMSQPNA